MLTMTTQEEQPLDLWDYRHHYSDGYDLQCPRTLKVTRIEPGDMTCPDCGPVTPQLVHVVNLRTRLGGSRTRPIRERVEDTAREALRDQAIALYEGFHGPALPIRAVAAAINRSYFATHCLLKGWVDFRPAGGDMRSPGRRATS